MNNVDDGTGNLETRIKLIRATSLGNYSWDSHSNGISNDWTQTDLKDELNGDYLDLSLTENTTWYNGDYSLKTAIFDISKRLTSVAQAQIGDAKWYLGGHNLSADRVPSIMYTKERGTEVFGSTEGQTCYDVCPRATEWTGKVALVYPSDYGYATAGGNTTNRSTCIGSLTTYSNSSGESWTNSSYSDCKNNDWLKPSSGTNWSLSPYTKQSRYTFYVRSNGTVDGFYAYSAYGVLPAVYLRSGVTITGGNGTPENPYVFS